MQTAISCVVDHDPRFVIQARMLLSLRGVRVLPIETLGGRGSLILAFLASMNQQMVVWSGLMLAKVFRLRKLCLRQAFYFKSKNSMAGAVGFLLDGRSGTKMLPASGGVGQWVGHMAG